MCANFSSYDEGLHLAVEGFPRRSSEKGASRDASAAAAPLRLLRLCGLSAAAPGQAGAPQGQREATVHADPPFVQVRGPLSPPVRSPNRPCRMPRPQLQRGPQYCALPRTTLACSAPSAATAAARHHLQRPVRRSCRLHPHGLRPHLAEASRWCVCAHATESEHILEVRVDAPMPRARLGMAYIPPFLSCMSG